MRLDRNDLLLYMPGGGLLLFQMSRATARYPRVPAGKRHVLANVLHRRASRFGIQADRVTALSNAHSPKTRTSSTTIPNQPKLIEESLRPRSDHRPTGTCGRTRRHLHSVVCELGYPCLGIASIESGYVRVLYPIDGVQVDFASDLFLLGQRSLREDWLIGTNVEGLPRAGIGGRRARYLEHPSAGSRARSIRPARYTRLASGYGIGDRSSSFEDQRRASE